MLVDFYHNGAFKLKNCFFLYQHMGHFDITLKSAQSITVGRKMVNPFAASAFASFSESKNKILSVFS